MTTLLLALQAAAMTLVFTEGHWSASIRARGPKLWRELVSCPLCLGVWVGMALRLLAHPWPYLPLIRLLALDVVGIGALSGVVAFIVKRLCDALDAHASQSEAVSKLGDAMDKKLNENHDEHFNTDS